MKNDNDRNSALIAKSLSAEVLEKYKEINFLCRIGEEISLQNDIKDIVEFLLKEINKIIPFDIGVFFLGGENLSSAPAAIVSPGGGFAIESIIKQIIEINLNAYKTKSGEIRNDEISKNGINFSIILTPFKTKKGISGILDIISMSGLHYNASNLAVLSAASAYAANAIEFISLYESEKSLVKILKEKNSGLSKIKNDLAKENACLKKDLKDRYSAKNIVGSSNFTQNLKKYIEKIADIPLNVVITGETGTGKEMVAKAIHYSSDRFDKPFIALNCSAIPESIFESELFGIEEGVATGVSGRKGKIFQANGGTLFLDEIADMPLTQQAKLLRFLEEGEIVSLGSFIPKRVDVRVISATNKDIKQEILSGNFRDDLYYRLNALNIHILPLRDRIEDVEMLTNHFIEECCERMDRKRPAILPEAMDALKRYPWPGNARELRNEVEHFIFLTSSQSINLSDLSDKVKDIYAELKESGLIKNKISNFTHSFVKDINTENDGPVLFLKDAEKILIKQALMEAEGNKTAAARILGISREGLRIKLKKLGIKK